ncbi:PIN domain-containing protein [Thermosulfurimonas sp.]|uniref:PIN domain-containing protein n=1 Tax=Thermosulfurimonas sp. TaxID=2080236 RepID=UPI0025CE9ED8|nr:PIN domain-containing protein [Thermosulfurimonas sp.]
MALTVFLDSNVLFSIAYSGPERSRSYLLFELEKKGRLRLYISELVFRETAVNLRLKRPEQEPFLKKLLSRLTILPDQPLGLPQLGFLPLQDRLILETAISNGLQFFLTGNRRHFGPLYGRKIKDTRVLSPAEFLHRRFGGKDAED